MCIYMYIYIYIHIYILIYNPDPKSGEPGFQQTPHGRTTPSEALEHPHKKTKK